ncbi:hypothetical protein K469DRAFT_731964 [Zopfia rhizophila CBS 207.26]|uniref:Integral membrane protein n=1 Tax=Zopfia rhizophila CBS 207.26 TaxID=1314779 RepID=A0A6A6EL53_9PEZI|nr:hypothetical protein K469DRAFT_731964 [Zopfia rhizophila CBS 207.26]
MPTQSPTWVVVSVEAPMDIGYQALAPVVAFTTLAIVLVLMRWYTRAFFTRKVGLEDFCITATLLIFAQSILYHASSDTTRASIVIQYLRIFSNTTIQWIFCLMLFLILDATAWSIFVFVSITNIFTDFVAWFLPMQKVGLMSIFGLGGFVCIVSVFRLALGHAAAEKQEVTTNVIIICASMLAMKPLPIHFFPDVMSSSPSSPSTVRVSKVGSGGWPTMISPSSWTASNQGSKDFTGTLPVVEGRGRTARNGET